MGYRIEYACDGSKKRTVSETHRGRKRNLRPIVFGILAALTAFMLVWPSGRLWVRDLLLPGDEVVTAAALGELVEELSQGKPVGESLEAFCREIISAA